MADKIIKLSLGGQERVLDFGCFWFTKHYQKMVNGSDLTMADNLEAYVISAIKANYSKERKKEDFTNEDIQNALGDMSTREMALLEKSIVEIIKSELPGEAEAPADGA